VSARNDRGGISVSEERIQMLLKEGGFDGYFKTSAKEGWDIAELRSAIEQAIQWESLPPVSSPKLFADIRSFLMNVNKTGRLLAPVSELYDDFIREFDGTPYRFNTTEGTEVLASYCDLADYARLREQFNICISRLANRDLIRRLTFGGYVLLQPELL